MDATRQTQVSRSPIGCRALDELPQGSIPGSRPALLGRRIRSLAAMATAMHCAQVTQQSLSDGRTGQEVAA